MFTNALEVTKFEGSTLVTVSGIRGHLKKAESVIISRFKKIINTRQMMEILEQHLKIKY